MSAHKRSVSQQYNKSSPGVRRILKEAQEIANSPSRDFTASPLEHNLFEWHFTLRGPPAPSPYAEGFYHGRIILSPNYPMRPPMFRFLTDSGRFEVNRDICLSISGFHEETWQPSWSIRLALVALRAFMDSEPEGQVGGLDCTFETRKKLATESQSWKCSECGGGGEEAALDVPEEEVGSSSNQTDSLPPELRFGYKDQMKPKQEGNETSPSTQQGLAQVPSPTQPVQQATPPAPVPTPERQGDQQEPALFIPFASAGGHQQGLNRQNANRQAGGTPGNIPTPTVTATVPAPAPRALVNVSNGDRAMDCLNVVIALLFGALAILILRKM